ncbi:DUF3846 domain-containing protein [Streptomyces sp. CAI 127]|uniref:DUF3846 domain-containing protein n=1 Tax=Streptomyces sp. CAI 127 TaxID=1076397 RepID=UPI0015874D53|nr:DUF3846 domain-containing protein [Streptomyces sp. CAI 127]NUW05226.1 DUF3846 domain-containing protein [Streptomyces sp. CAI 127]
MTTEQKKNHALILRTNGEFEIIDWPACGDRGHLEILYRATDSRAVDGIDISPTLTMWLNNAAPNANAPVNRTASILYALHREPHQLYHGTAVFTGGADPQGETRGLTKDEIASLVEMHLTFLPVTVPGMRDRRGS